ncbi:MAG: NAD-dependent epimerase/dehydratase family protein [Dehalococcoidia bacterium]|nr:NAD-dependent epimerase/dehydratase family protein [Dehalococcoidia bacterium]
MKIFITGGTGFIGSYLVKQLLQTEHKLLCLTREKSNIQFLKEAGVDIFIGDVADKASLQKGMEGCDWVVHLASSFIFWFSNNRVFYDVNVTGTRHVMESALENGISKVVYVSTAAVYGNADWPIKEDTPFGTERASKYVRTKYKGDLIAWDLYKEKKLPLVVIYPSAVIGASDPKAAGRYIKNYAQGRMPAQVLTKIYFPFVHVKDVAEAIVKALEKENNIGEKYIVSAANYTWGEINQMISEISGTKLPFLKFPNWLTVMTSYLLTGIANLVGKPPIWDLSVDQVNLMKQSFKIDGGKAERELGIKYTPVYDGIKDAIESYK